MRYLAGVATLELDPSLCRGCAMCTRVCPHAVLRIEAKKATIVDRDACMECGACARNCEHGAIKVRSGVGCANAVLNSMMFGGAPTCDCGSGDSSSCCG